MKTCPIAASMAALAVLSFGSFAGPIATTAQTKSASPHGLWNYILLPGSLWTDDCFCGRPTISTPLQGTFQLRWLEQTPLYTRYSVEAISWKASQANGPTYQITGHGTYQIGGEVALSQNMFLELQIQDETTNRPGYFTNSLRSVERAWPILQLHLDQTNGTIAQFFRIDLVAAPIREFWFTTANSFHAGIWDASSNYVSAGDLLSSAGRVVKRDTQLTAKLGVMPPVPDLGLDALDVQSGGEIAFSITQDVYSETLGSLSDGDVLSDRGRILFTFDDLTRAFTDGPPVPASGLDALQVVDTNEVYFSVKTNFWSKKLGQWMRRGDLLSSQGMLVKSNEELVARFNPGEPKNDYGLDALYVWPDGEIWFSVEDGFYGSHFDYYGPGDLLSDQGYVVYRNLDLMAAFQPLEDLADFGLNALYTFSDFSAPPVPAPIAGLSVDAPINGLILHAASNGWFQLERTTDVLGPWIPTGPIADGTNFTDPGGLTNFPQAFYRIRQF